jgi:hypothetical protein
MDQLGRVDIILQFASFFTDLPSGFATWPNVLFYFDVCFCKDQEDDQECLNPLVDQEDQDEDHSVV